MLQPAVRTIPTLALAALALLGIPGCTPSIGCSAVVASSPDHAGRDPGGSPRRGARRLGRPARSSGLRPRHRVHRRRLSACARRGAYPSRAAVHRHVGRLVPHVPEPAKLRLSGPVAAALCGSLRVALDRRRARGQRSPRRQARRALLAHALRDRPRHRAARRRMARVPHDERARDPARRRGGLGEPR